MDLFPSDAETVSKYEALKALGKGAFGVVSLMRNKETKSLCVVKRMHLQEETVEEIQAIKAEVELLSTLKHPNIVGYQEVYIDPTDRNAICIVMDFCDGGDLDKRIKHAVELNYRFDENQIMSWFTQLVMALDYLHRRTIIHRDLKGQNVFLMKNGMIKLGDFGVSKIMGPSAMAKTMVGTPYYLSPEIIKGDGYDFKSDIWSLGCILYELCTLNRPFDGDNMFHLMANIQKGEYKAMDPMYYSTPLHDLVTSLLQLNPTMRPSSSDILSSPWVTDHVTRVAEELSAKPTQTIESETTRKNALLLMAKRPMLKRTKTNMSCRLMLPGQDDQPERKGEVSNPSEESPTRPGMLPAFNMANAFRPEPASIHSDKSRDTKAGSTKVHEQTQSILSKTKVKKANAGNQSDSTNPMTSDSSPELIHQSTGMPPVLSSKRRMSSKKSVGFFGTILAKTGLSSEDKVKQEEKSDENQTDSTISPPNPRLTPSDEKKNDDNDQAVQYVDTATHPEFNSNIASRNSALPFNVPVINTLESTLDNEHGPIPSNSPSQVNPNRIISSLSQRRGSLPRPQQTPTMLCSIHHELHWRKSSQLLVLEHEDENHVDEHQEEDLHHFLNLVKTQYVEFFEPNQRFVGDESAGQTSPLALESQMPQNTLASDNGESHSPSKYIIPQGLPNIFVENESTGLESKDQQAHESPKDRVGQNLNYLLHSDAVAASTHDHTANVSWMTSANRKSEKATDADRLNSLYHENSSFLANDALVNQDSSPEMLPTNWIGLGVNQLGGNLKLTPSRSTSVLRDPALLGPRPIPSQSQSANVTPILSSLPQRNLAALSDPRSLLGSRSLISPNLPASSLLDMSSSRIAHGETGAPKSGRIHDSFLEQLYSYEASDASQKGTRFNSHNRREPLPPLPSSSIQKINSIIQEDTRLDSALSDHHFAITPSDRSMSRCSAVSNNVDGVAEWSAADGGVLNVQSSQTFSSRKSRRSRSTSTGKDDVR
eukprot:TRINITY_DN3191_c0_g1_i2.p1 TRINITY_DN3191_c0_g1~~TRINITY_DN3191_c0_g1_i2.p1  ORF type:complete len:994 (-),score=170.42 TRINITY_DN3191_c0_g1_i2:482-3463(-)